MNGLSLYSTLTRSQKKALLVLLDLFFLPAALWSSFALRFADVFPQDRMEPFWWMFVYVPLVGVVIFTRNGLYRAVIRYMGVQAVYAVIKGVLLLSLSLYVVAHLSAEVGFPRSIPINFAIISGLYVAGSRYLIKSYYHKLINPPKGKEAVLIYGAGEAGIQLVVTLANSNNMKAVAFVDDDVTLHGEIVNGLAVYSPSQFSVLIKEYDVKRVILAIPAASTLRRKQVAEKLKSFTVRVQSIPSLAELAAGSSGYSQLQELSLDELLGRDVVVPDEKLLAHSVAEKVVMVTGAGGSIGSELCRQIVMLKPSMLIMFDVSEYALYTIEKELINNQFSELAGSPRLYAVLGSVCDVSRVEHVIKHFDVKTLFHAAAYKHVPMVEHNVLEGVRNNIFGTKVVAEAAIKCGVERFMLISTDKAVRPTSVMGATKRAAELVIQSISEQSNTTKFSIVRFGNVLGSSGSVVPLFKEQIERGGPVTVTHKEVTRYFMSIPEAAQLVIQSASMAKGGEVFVLDMGESVSIFDLARNMIELSGLRVRDENNKQGDISIIITGLRSGEKLHEELLLGDKVSKTEHDKIMCADERGIDGSELSEFMKSLEFCLDSSDAKRARNVLVECIHSYKSESGFVDNLNSNSCN